ncbi:MAG: hypothetical protein ACI865_002781 [Flavobacteriaceae bacterium]|jgi:hypothetical protein
MKYTSLHMCILFSMLFWQPLIAQQTYTEQQVLDDIAFLESRLIRYHPNLYLYSKQDEFNALSRGLKDVVQSETTALEAYRQISSYSQIIRDGHTSITPSKEVISGFHTDTALFPLRTYWDGEFMHSIMDFGNEASIPDGSEILSINGIKVDKILQNMFNSLQHDGDNMTYPTWILNNFFTAYYYFYYGANDSFGVEYLPPHGEKKFILLPAICKVDRAKNRAHRYPKYSEQFKDEKKTGITLKETENASAILTIKSFDNSILRKDYRQSFRRSIRKTISQLKKNETQTLIVDLRGNQGGHLTNGHFLLKRLMSHRYIMVECYTKVNKKCSHVANERNKPTHGPILGIKKPNKRRFDGELYFLVDGGSFSCSGIVTHVIKAYDRGTIVGEETGGSAYSLVGSPNKRITLPNTGINVTIPRLQFILQDLTDTEKSGTHPDVVISPSFGDIMKDKDVVLDQVLEIIRAKQ